MYYLEKRVEQLEKLLVANKVSFPPADDLEAYCKGEPLEEPVPMPKVHQKLLNIDDGAPFMSTVFNALSPDSEKTADSDPMSALPSRALGTQLVEAYFERVNPQLPIVSRVDFLRIFDAAYAGEVLSPQDWYYMYMVFAIGQGHGFIDGDDADKDLSHEYYTVAAANFDACINSPDKLEVLRAVLLLCSYALLRPVGPGVW